MIGAILKGYKITEKVKEGSVGAIYKAIDPSGAVVAIKQISPRNVANPAKLKAFKREADISRKLKHPCIIKVYDYIDHSPQPFFVMEYFESENLKFCMHHARERIQTLEFTILKRLAEAMDYTHRQGIVHRDIKPENLLVNAQSEIRLIDFSLAQTSWDRIFSMLGRRICGTPQYMSPEQLLGKSVDHRTDIYSFGALAYEFLTGKPLFTGRNEQELLQKHLTASPPSLKQSIPTASDEIDLILRKMLEKDPRKRYDDFSTIIIELSRWERKDTTLRQRQTDAPKSPFSPRPKNP